MTLLAKTRPAHSIQERFLISGHTVHPVRWATILLVAVPLLLMLLAGMAALVDYTEESRNLVRWVRLALIAEGLALVVLAGVGAVYQATFSARDQRLYLPPGKLVNIGGYRLHLYCLGQRKPTVVLESGLGGSWLDWHSVQSQIATFSQVCAYDRAGYGVSEPSPLPRTSINSARELHALLHNAGLEPPYVLVGHSMGGYTVRMFTSLYPQEVAAIVLVDSSHPDVHDHSWEERLWIKFLRWTAPFGLPRWRHWCGGGPQKIQAMKSAIECRTEFYKTYDAELGSYQESSQQVRQAAPMNEIPLIVISRDPNQNRNNGNRDRWRNWLERQQELSRLSAHGKLVVAAGSSHAVMRDRPDVVIDAVQEIVQAVRLQFQSGRAEVEPTNKTVH